MSPASLDLSKPPLVTLIAGPTASGKSALALKMARETGAVIINADSQQLYADLRILTARPSLEEEAQADHRLYGVADAAEAWSVGKWSRAALDELDRLHARPAVIVGGTGLYFAALTKGLADIPIVPIDVRDAMTARYQAEGEQSFRAALARHDPDAAVRVEIGDRQRLIRAMSVLEVSGQPISHWQSNTRPLLKPDSWTGVVIEPNRAALYARCDRRVEQMMTDGALAEVEALMKRRLAPALPAMKAVGVRELAEHLGGNTGRAAAVDALKQSTRNYAKRQLTWFRNQTPDWARAEV
jgi:tRNA dimethylallyltransferase